MVINSLISIQAVTDGQIKRKKCYRHKTHAKGVGGEAIGCGVTGTYKSEEKEDSNRKRSKSLCPSFTSYGCSPDLNSQPQRRVSACVCMIMCVKL